MSEQPVAAPSRPKPPGKTYLGLTRNQLYITGGVFVAVLGYLLWKRHQASTAAASSTGGATNQGSNECTDQNGNPVDCNEAFAQELAAMQNALDQLGASSGGGGSAGGGGWTGTGTDTGTGTTTGTGTGTDTGTTSGTTVTQPAATPTSSRGSTSTAARAKTAGAITGLHSTGATKNSISLAWNPASNAQEYSFAVRDLASHTGVSAGQTNATSVTVNGLKAGTDYNFGIQALPGGAGNNIHVRTK